jgi:hypothetical protein
VAPNLRENTHLFYGKGNENHELVTFFFVRKRITSAVKRVQFVGDRMSYIILRSRRRDVDEITGDHQCAFRRNRSTTDQISYIHQILEKKWEYNETVHQLFIDFNNAYDSVRREVLYNILIEFGVPMKLVRLIKMRFNKTYI